MNKGGTKGVAGRKRKATKKGYVRKGKRGRTAKNSGVPDDEDDLFIWEDYLKKNHAKAVPIETFKHVQDTSTQGFAPGMKLEARDRTSPDNNYWVATVVMASGPLLLLRFDGSEDDRTGDFWCDARSDDLQPVGFCAASNNILVPPEAIRHKESNWVKFLMKDLNNAVQAPSNLFHKTADESSENQLKPGLKLEIVDKENPLMYWIATVVDVYGLRLYLQYEGCQGNAGAMWAYFLSDNVHQLGWGFVNALTLRPPARLVSSMPEQDWSHRRDTLLQLVLTTSPDQSLDAFYGKEDHLPDFHGFMPGMKLEAVHPKDPSSICVATVSQLVNERYFLVELDNLISHRNNDKVVMCCHSASRNIFPVGWCELYGIQLTPPAGYHLTWPFQWDAYLKWTNASAAPDSLFDQVVPEHEFDLGLKLEAVDQTNPQVITMATVTQVVGRTVWLQLDGYQDDSVEHIYDVESHDLFPCGWCSMNGHPLLTPKNKNMPNAGNSRLSTLRTRGPKGRAALERMGSVPDVSTDSDNSNSNSNSAEKTTNSLENGTSDGQSSDDASLAKWKIKVSSQSENARAALVKTRTKRESEDDEGARRNAAKKVGRGRKKNSSEKETDAELLQNSNIDSKPPKYYNTRDTRSTEVLGDLSSNADEAVKGTVKNVKGGRTPPTIAVKGIRRTPTTRTENEGSKGGEGGQNARSAENEETSGKGADDENGEITESSSESEEAEQKQRTATEKGSTEANTCGVKNEEAESTIKRACRTTIPSTTTGGAEKHVPTAEELGEAHVPTAEELGEAHVHTAEELEEVQATSPDKEDKGKTRATTTIDLTDDTDSETEAAQASTPATGGTSKNIYIHVKHSCATGPFLNRLKFQTIPAVIGPLNASAALRSLVEQIVFSSLNSKDVLKILADQKTKMNIARILKTLTSTLSSCENLFSLSKVTQCAYCDKIDTPSLTPSGMSPETGTEQHVMWKSKHVSQWTVRDSVDFVNFAGYGKFARNFREQEVDGRALMLLSLEEIHRCLGITLGPAVIIYDEIQRLKKQPK